MSLGTQNAKTGPFPYYPVFILQGYWCSIPEIIWMQLHKFWERVDQQAAETTKSWGLPCSFLITYIFQKKGIKGTSADGPITEHPQFGRIQWNKSYSHMPRGHRARVVDEPELMDIDKAIVATAEPEAVAEEEVEQEKTITISAADFYALQETLADIRFELADMQRDACQDKLKADERYEAQQAMLQAILARLPPASGASSSALQ
jgi:hypothetical protein